MPSTTAVTNPGLAVGSTTFHTVRHWLPPSAYEASRRVPGTSRITTSAARVTIGIIITVSAREAAKPLFSQPSVTITMPRMNRPATIDGSAVIASTSVRTGRAIRPPTSDMKTAAAMPSGTANSVARPSCSSEPTTAFRAPPEVIGESAAVCSIDSVKKFRWLAACSPRAST